MSKTFFSVFGSAEVLVATKNLKQHGEHVGLTVTWNRSKRLTLWWVEDGNWQKKETSTLQAKPDGLIEAKEKAEGWLNKIKKEGNEDGYVRV